MNPFKIEFKKPYKFEGKEYTEVDLSGIENLATKDLIDADKQFNAAGHMAVMNETQTAYSCIVASKSTKLPVEFFENLPMKYGVQIKGIVMNFLNG
ncbi:phage tail assembly protein [Bacillaceae bacterium IKA-2]|nr:phage tail assembly protein [Bacillaceae bacterium IKA-2]